MSVWVTLVAQHLCGAMLAEPLSTSCYPKIAVSWGVASMLPSTLLMSVHREANLSGDVFRKASM